MLLVELQNISQTSNIPSKNEFVTWLNIALPNNQQDTELTIRIVDEEEMRSLNHQFRSKDKPTNVLAFPYDEIDENQIALLGDLVLCAPVIANEARQQQKPEQAHWAHLTIHGTLHLIGYDHQEDDQAAIMEALEIKLLELLGYPNPYQQPYQNTTESEKRHDG